MQSRQIAHLMYTDPYAGPFFRGVFPIDRLPEINIYPSAMVVNLDKHDEPGSHWVALYFDKNKNCEFFNSYRVEPKGVLKEYISKNSDSSSYNNKQVQQLLTHTCGQFCVFFLIWRARNVSMKTITASLEKRSADYMVTDFVNSLYKINTKIFDLNFLDYK